MESRGGPDGVRGAVRQEERAELRRGGLAVLRRADALVGEQPALAQELRAQVGVDAPEADGAVVRPRRGGVGLVVGLGPVAGVKRENFGQHEIPARLEPDARAVGRVGVLGAVHEGRVPQNHEVVRAPFEDAVEPAGAVDLDDGAAPEPERFRERNRAAVERDGNMRVFAERAEGRKLAQRGRGGFFESGDRGEEVGRMLNAECRMLNGRASGSTGLRPVT